MAWLRGQTSIWLMFLEISKCILGWLMSSKSSIQVSGSTALRRLGIIRLLNLSYSSGCALGLHCGFNLHILETSETEFLSSSYQLPSLVSMLKLHPVSYSVYWKCYSMSCLFIFGRSFFRFFDKIQNNIIF